MTTATVDTLAWQPGDLRVLLADGGAWDEESHPRDDRGRFGEGGGATPTWSPTMSREEAARWASGSVVQEIMFHGTTIEAGSAIKSDGFDVDKAGSATNYGGSYGIGIYVTNDHYMAAGYGDKASNFTRGGSEVLEIRVNVQNPLTGDALAHLLSSNEIPHDYSFEQGAAYIRDYALAHGHDAVYATGQVDLIGKSKPDELVVFDPHNVVVLK